MNFLEMEQVSSQPIPFHISLVLITSSEEQPRTYSGRYRRNLASDVPGGGNAELLQPTRARNVSTIEF
jgi:hypothetical protein